MPQHLCYERRMQRTRQPCRHLNSEGIKSTALCYLTPVISGRCSIISAKCVCKSKIRPCQRRGQLFVENEICAAVQYQVSICCNMPISDEISKNILVQKFDAFYLSSTAGIHNVAFCFSAIASQEKISGSISKNTEEESSSGDEIRSSISQQWLEGNLTNVNKSLCPAIAY